jgi:hypothetical protein
VRVEGIKDFCSAKEHNIRALVHPGTRKNDG